MARSAIQKLPKLDSSSVRVHLYRIITAKPTTRPQTNWVGSDWMTHIRNDTHEHATGSKLSL